MTELRKVATRVLSKTTSASACERNWSVFSAVQTPQRNRLHHSTLTDLVDVRINLRLQQKKDDKKFKDRVAEWVEYDEQGSDASDAEVGEEEADEIDDALFMATKERVIAEWEKAYLANLLSSTGGNVSQAARKTGLQRPYLHRLLRKHGLRGGGEPDAAS